jgi:hypothetical protein
MFLLLFTFLLGFFVAVKLDSIVPFIFNVKKTFMMVTQPGFLYDFALFKLRENVPKLIGTGHLTDDKKHYNLSYFLGTTNYIIKFPKHRGPCPFQKVHATFVAIDMIDVTHNVRLYAGPSHNFHGIRTTPADLGYYGLKFIMMDDTVKTFLEHEFIEL